MIKVSGFGEGVIVEAECGSLINMGRGLTVIVLGADERAVSRAAVNAARAIAAEEREVSLDEFMGIESKPPPDSSPMHAFGQGRGD